jgi:ParB family chromosome partitioning protein
MTSKKKRFGTLAIVGEGISSVLRNTDSSTDGLNVEQIPLSRLDPDPENPRRLGIDRETLVLYAKGHPVPENLQASWAALQELSQSIKQIGVQQAIKCYRFGDRFRIAFGERRFYASILADRETIPAWILDERPPLLRRIQYAENVLRENLTPWERVSNVFALIEEYKVVEDKELSSRGLAEILGISHTQANSYLSIIRGPKDVQEWLQHGSITTIDTAAALARVEEPEKRKQALEAIREGKDLKIFLDPTRKGTKEAVEVKTEEDLSKKARQSYRGRPNTYVNLGRTTQPEVVRRIISAMSGDTTIPDIDWTDMGAVSKAWIAFLHALERGSL